MAGDHALRGWNAKHAGGPAGARHRDVPAKWELRRRSAQFCADLVMATGPSPPSSAHGSQAETSGATCAAFLTRQCGRVTLAGRAPATGLRTRRRPAVAAGTGGAVSLHLPPVRWSGGAPSQRKWRQRPMTDRGRGARGRGRQCGRWCAAGQPSRRAHRTSATTQEAPAMGDSSPPSGSCGRSPPPASRRSHLRCGSGRACAADRADARCRAQLG